jgi:hypothetical protein
MKIKTSELTGAALDWAVAKCEGVKVEQLMGLSLWSSANWEQYSTDWAQAGPIIEREKIDLFQTGPVVEHENINLFTEKQTYPESWCASVTRYQNGRRLVGWRLHQYGPTPLIAAMRCYVARELGDTVDIPEELCK